MSNTMDLQSIRLLRRSDLEVVCRKSGSAFTDEEWIVKDPIQLNYFFLDRVQHWLFEKLDGSTSLKDIQQSFTQAFSGAKISEQQLLHFCMRLGRDGLLCESLSGETMLQRQKQQTRTPLHKLPLSLMAVRFPGFNAGSVISLADSIFGWIFAPWMVLLSIAWLAFAFLFGIQALDEIVWALPSLSNVRLSDIIMLLVCVSIVKIVHELAHAVCCRRMGAKCNEIGVMFLVFSPCLYCNVTDAWMLPAKWKRIAISAAGIYVELLIASASLFLWHYAETEFLKSLFLNLMIVCSVSTLLVNGNPLMRYDGYFILSDFVGVPNLSQQARSKTWSLLGKLFFLPRRGIGNQNETGSSILLVVYHVASVVYRIFVLTVIFFLFHALLEPVGLKSVATSIAIVYIACLLTGFVLAFVPMLRNSNRGGHKNWLGILATVMLLCGLAYFVVSVKVPHSISTSARIEFNELATCTAKIRGNLESAIEAGEYVREGESIARLSNFESTIERTKLTNKIEVAKLKIESLTSRSGVDPDSRIALPSAESELKALINELAMLDERRSELEILAPTSGIVVESFKQPTENSSLELSSWHGSALDKRNLGCSIEQGETICLIAKRDDWKVYLLVDEKKRDLISSGQRVALRTSLQRNRLYEGTVGKVFSDTIEKEDSGRRLFRVEVVPDEPVSIGFHRAEGKAKVTTGRQTLWETCRRFILESFRFEI